MTSSFDDSRAIIESLGLVPVINAAGYPSRLGGATLGPAVRAAMAQEPRLAALAIDFQTELRAMLVDLAGEARAKARPEERA